MLDLDPAEIIRQADADPELRLRARHFTGTIRLRRGAESWDFRFGDGRPLTCDPTRRGNADDAAIVYTNDQQGWAGLLAAKPAPFHVDAMNSRHSGATIDGDVVGAVGPYYPLLQRVIGLLRQLRTGVMPALVGGALDWEQEHATGRYVPIETNGTQYRVYIEEAGDGIPLLLQHTAGADARQWRHVLADPEITRDFHVIAYDLPYHGFSLPPITEPWWEHPYRPTKQQLMDWIVAIIRCLNLDRPVFLGCSVGGHLATDLIAHHADLFRASISVNGWYHQDPFGRFDNSRFTDPRISDEYSASISYGSTTPYGPEALRREAHWLYGSSQHGAYAGDNEYFMTGHDLREDGHLIDTRRTPLYIVAGEYDPAAAFPEAGASAIAANIVGSKQMVVPHLGHFMMVDNPAGFREALLPLLRKIRAAEAGAAARVDP